MKCLALSVHLLVSILVTQAGIASANSCMPFIGEQMNFSVSWEFIHGGSAQLNVSAKEKNGYRIQSTAKSNKFLDIFHKVRDRMVSEGICVNGKMQSILFDMQQHESKYRSKKHADFLWQDNKVVYRLNENEEMFDVPAGHLDVIDAFFATRLEPLEIGKTVNIPIFDARKRYEVVVNVLKKDKIKAPWGEKVECLVIEPKLKTAGIFASKGKIKVWLTNDKRRIPLRMTAKLKFGRIVARLNEYKRIH